MMQEKHFKAEQDRVGSRLDSFLAEQDIGLTRSAIQKLFSDNLILVNGQPITKNYRIRNADEISIQIPAKQERKAYAQNIPVEIVYEDADLLVVNKPKGMVVHPAAGNEDGTLVNALLYHCAGKLSDVNGDLRPGIVHRIDRDTSGLLVVAKTNAAHIGLAEQIKAHSMERCYQAIVYNNIKEDAGRIDLPIGRHSIQRKKMCVTENNSRNAVTHFKVLQRLKGFTHVLLRLETGRTHQIRVHMAYLGYPVAGDPVYGPKKVITSLKGQCLHAQTLGFIHPITGKAMTFSSEPPEEFKNFLNKLERMES